MKKPSKQKNTKKKTKKTPKDRTSSKNQMSVYFDANPNPYWPF